MTTKFIVEFREHLTAEQISNLKGILLFNGTGREESGKFVLEVHRASRVSFTAIELGNWDALGWLTWSSDPKLSQERPENSN